MTSSTILELGALGALGFLCQWIAWRVKLPAILFLLIAGIVIGPVLGLLNPDALFGDLLFPFVSLAVAIILFEGSLTLKKSELPDIGSTVRAMVTYGLFVNAAITTLAVHFLTGLSWSLSLLFGSIMVVTGPTVIVPMLKAIKLNSRISRTLRWEGIIIDPIGALLAVLVFELVLSQQMHINEKWPHILGLFVATILTGVFSGTISAIVFGQLLRRHWIPEYLRNYAALAFVTITFALSDFFMHESGLVAVTVMGIILVNMSGVHIRSILNFKENLTTVFVSILFILLAARLNFTALYQLGFGALGVFLVMQFIARPLKIYLCTLGSSFSTGERLMLAWVGPRGIVAAAVCAAFAFKLEIAGVADAKLLVPLSFSVIVGTVLLQGITARAMGKFLGVSEPNNKGALIIGSNPVSILIAKMLKDQEIEVLMCDTYWDSLSEARMEGIKTYYGNPVSNHAELYLDKSGLGCAICLSYDRERNATSALRFREDFGAENVYSLTQFNPGKDEDKHHISDYYKSKTLFGKDISYGVLASLISRGATIRKTTLTDNYTYENWKADNEELKSLPLCVIDKNDSLHWKIDGKELKIGNNSTLVSLALARKPIPDLSTES